MSPEATNTVTPKLNTSDACSNQAVLLQPPARGRMSNGKDKSQADKNANTYSLIEVSKDSNKWLEDEVCQWRFRQCPTCGYVDRRDK
jgi:hypothetical protein